jgi:benzoate membrane transport protein
MSVESSATSPQLPVLPPRRSLRQLPGDLRRDVSVSAGLAGLVAIVIGYAGPAVVLIAAARAGHLSPALTASWVWAASIGSGLLTIGLSLWTRVPVVVAWSTPGAALLVTSIAAYPYPQLIGAYLVAAVAMVALAASGSFDALLRRIPATLVSAMLAGVLLPFVGHAATALHDAPAVTVAVLVGYLLTGRRSPRFAVPAALTLGFATAAALGGLDLHGVRLQAAVPVVTAPQLSFAAVIGVALPLFVVTLTAQNAAGLEVLRELGHPADARRLVTATGLGSVAMAPFGSHAINLAAITAALCAGPGAHPDRSRRYVAGLSAGVAYLVVGSFGASLIAVFAALPLPLVYAVGGVALLPAFTMALVAALREPAGRTSAALCLLVTASGISVAGISSPFWGVVTGLVAHLLGEADLPRRDGTGRVDGAAVAPVP